MNRTNHIILAAISLLLCACNGNKIEIAEPHSIKVVGKDFFDVPYQETVLDAEIEANCQWTISKTNSDGEGLSWIKVDVPNSTGRGSKQFRIKILENDTDKARSGMLNIYSDQVTAYIDIRQAANPNPNHEPEPFVGYSFPAYQWLSASSVSASGPSIKCDGGLVIEKISNTDVSTTSIDNSLLPGLNIALDNGDGIIFKIPLTYPLSGDLRFMFGSNDANAGSVSDYEWSSDEGLTWNPVSRIEETSVPVFKSVWLSIPDTKMIDSESWLWIKAQKTSSSTSVVGGIGLVKASAAKSALAPEDTESVIISEGFDNTQEANAAYLDAPEYMSSIHGEAWVSDNAAITTAGVYARPGFIQVGGYDEATPDAGTVGSINLNVGARLQAMGITGKTDIIINFKAAGIKNALGVDSDAKIAVKSGEEVLAQVSGLKAGTFSDYKFNINDADNSTTLTITSLGTGADTRFFVDDIFVTVVSTAPPTGPVELTIDFTQPDNMSEWNTQTYPGLESDYMFESFYTIEGETYSFKYAISQDLVKPETGYYFPYYNTTAHKFTMPVDSYLGLPAIPGLKLTKVSLYRNVGKHPQWGITDGVYNISDTKVFISEPKETTNNDWGAHELSGTEAGKMYWIYVSVNTFAFEQLVLNYEP